MTRLNLAIFPFLLIQISLKFRPKLLKKTNIIKEVVKEII